MDFARSPKNYKIGQGGEKNRAAAAAAAVDSVHSRLQNVVDSLTSLLYAESTDSQPVLTPKVLQQQMRTLEAHINHLATQSNNLLQLKSQHTQMYHDDPLLLDERDLFVLFHTDPSKLSDTVEKLLRRVQAHFITPTSHEVNESIMD
eukprot:comp18514_c0_seq1/m.19914 comp18514_c0_seq1/g.19914  ORF comp18514_c0_seq1/g.19914 comp18514_c0_seq1/m.19914 type:complete len:147 (-) comp18514_c0_seq1:606-1046(-)